MKIVLFWQRQMIRAAPSAAVAYRLEYAPCLYARYATSYVSGVLNVVSARR
jgi:hypothetical protein